MWFLDRLLNGGMINFEEAGAGSGGGAGAGAGGGTGVASHTEPVKPDLPAFDKLIPEGYADKSWVKETKDLPSLFKRMDDTLTEMGKRPAGIPQDNASEDEWKVFHKALGVPDKAEDYAFGEVPKELEEVAKNEAFQTGIRKLLHKAGISTRQAGVLIPGWNEIMINVSKNSEQISSAAQAKQDEDFNALADKTFGDRREKVLGVSKGLIAHYVPEGLKSHVEGLSNENLMILASVLDGVQREFISEDRLPGGGEGATPESEDAKRAKARTLMASEAYQKPFHAEHTKVVAEVKAIYASLKAT